MSLTTLGFEVIPGFAPEPELRDIRARFSAILQGFEPLPGDRFQDPALGSIMLNAAQREPDLFAKVLDHAPLWDGLRRATGSKRLLLIPETSIHRNSFGDWHKDTRAQEVAGHYFHWTPFYKVFTVALYFQDNSPDVGGGLEVIPRSHLTRKTVFGTSGVVGTRLTSGMGDALVFDMRLDHKAAWPRDGAPKADKVALYFTVCCPNSGGDLYVRFLRTRPDYAYLKGFECPAPLDEVLRRHGIAILN